MMPDMDTAPLRVDTDPTDPRVPGEHLTSPMDYLDTSPRDLDQTKKWIVGAAIINYVEPASEHGHELGYAVLVLQRAEGTSFPGNWELAGGKVEPSDHSIRDALAREVHEETGLVVKTVLGEIDDVHELQIEIDRKGLVPIRYAVSVEDPRTVTLSPQEHCNYKWITAEDVEALSMSPGMRKAVQNACKYAASHRKS